MASIRRMGWLQRGVPGHYRGRLLVWAKLAEKVGVAIFMS